MTEFWSDDEQLLLIKGCQIFVSKKYYFNVKDTCDFNAQFQTTTAIVRKLHMLVSFRAESGEMFNMKVVTLGLSFPAI